MSNLFIFKMLENKIKKNPYLGYLQNYIIKTCCFCEELDESSLAHCHDCGLYFCNNLCKEESHIVSHLKQCKHSHISTDLFSKDKLKCESCEKDNIFELKFLKISEKEYSFLCKECSKYQILYSNIIENNKINNEILRDPMIPPVANFEALIYTMNIDIKKWVKLQESGIPPSSISYLNKKEYSQQLITLITEEIETIKYENSKSPLLTFDLEFDYQEDNQCFITVKNPIFKLFEKNKLDIFKNDNLIIEEAKVRFKTNDSAILFCRNVKYHFENGKYQLQLKESVKNYERMIAGLIKLGGKKNLMNQSIMKMLLGQVQDLSINIREKNVKQISLIPKLLQERIKMNVCQEQAIKNALMYHLSIVIGPPGSGKTFLLVNLVYNIHKGSTEKILICAQTNQAIDNIIKLLKKFDFSKFVRVLSPAKELSEDLDTTNSVNKLVIEKINKNPKKYQELIKLIDKKERNGILSEKDYKRYKEKMSDVEDEIIEDADIVLSTLNNSADERLKNYNFSYVLIDEAAQALEADTLLPLIHQAQMVVLIGDDKQLGPVIHSERAEAAGLSISLFQRLHLLYQNAPFITLLNEQYRMNEKLYEFPNRKFYENKMITRVRVLPDENIIQNIPWPKKDFPSFFYKVSGYEEEENNSYINKDEVFSVFQCVNKLIENKVELKNIGVLTFYSAQKQRFYEKFYTKEQYQELKIDTVDGFQGMEMDYIIISTVRSNPYGKLGFLKSEKRLNVSLTRARKGLILVGNPNCLAQRPGVFRDLISFYCSNGLIVDDPFKNCKIIKREEIFDKDLLDNEEEYDEIIEEIKERNYNGLRKIKVIKKIKNEKPAPSIAINPQNLGRDNQNQNKQNPSIPINQQNQKKDNHNQNKQIKNINNNKIEENNKNNNKEKNKKKEEKEVKVEQIKQKKKKKAKKIEENEEEKKEEEEKEELKKKGNKKWKIKNLYNKKKNQEEKQEEKKKNVNIEEEKNEEEIHSGKKGRKNQAKQKNEKQGKKKKNDKK